LFNLTALQAAGVQDIGFPSIQLNRVFCTNRSHGGLVSRSAIWTTKAFSTGEKRKWRTLFKTVQKRVADPRDNVKPNRPKADNKYMQMLLNLRLAK
jgi:hypothetical protein